MRIRYRWGVENLVRGRLILAAALITGLAIVPPPSSAAHSRRLSAVQAHYLSLAERGVEQTSHWASPRRPWYNALLQDRRAFPLAPLWDAWPLWRSVIQIAQADPSSGHRRAVRRFANFAESYWDPALKPGPGYIPYPASSPDSGHTHTKAFFDDDGWWGLAFLDAYTTVGNRRYLKDAEKAFGFISRYGWDRHGGGIWWNNFHPYRSSESLAAATALSARLYQVTHRHLYLHWVVKLITWANHHVLKWDGSYAQKFRDEGAMSNAGEGAMLSGLTALCDRGVAVPKAVYAGVPPNHFWPSGTSDRLPTDPGAWCSWAEALATKTVLGVPSKQYTGVDALVPLNDDPPQDAVYVDGLLDLYRHDHNPLWYSTAIDTATRILQNSRGRRGLYLRAWSGDRKIRGSEPGMLRDDAASVSVFAALALVRPPGARP